MLPECVASSDQNSQPVLNEPETDFGEVGAFAYTVDSDERDAVGHALLG